MQFYHPYPGGRVAVEVHDRSRCIEDASVVVDALIQVAPDPRFIAGDPRATWIDIVGHQLRCCGEPAVLVDDALAPGGLDHVLSLRDCTPDPCDCAPGHRVDFVEHHYLGSLPPGRTRVRLDAVVLPIDVP